MAKISKSHFEIVLLSFILIILTSCFMVILNLISRDLLVWPYFGTHTITLIGMYWGMSTGYLVTKILERIRPRKLTSSQTHGHSKFWYLLERMFIKYF